MRLEIDAKDVSEMANKLTDLAKLFNMSAQGLNLVPGDGTKPTRKRRTREELAQARAEGIAEGALTDEQIEALPADPEPVRAPTKEDVTAKLKAVVNKLGATAPDDGTVAPGLLVGREILLSFGAGKLGELKAEDYAAFIEKCNERLA